MRPVSLLVDAIFWLLLQLWPACPAEGWVTSEYGYRRHPVTKKGRFHWGIDIGNYEGTPVRSPWSAQVTLVGRTRGAGRFVILTSGRMTIHLAHFKKIKVSEGDQVKKGDLVGLMGHTGRATGDHLHIEIKDRGKHLNPWPVLVSCPHLP